MRAAPLRPRVAHGAREHVLEYPGTRARRPRAARGTAGAGWHPPGRLQPCGLVRRRAPGRECAAGVARSESGSLQCQWCRQFEVLAPLAVRPAAAGSAGPRPRRRGHFKNALCGLVLTYVCTAPQLIQRRHAAPAAPPPRAHATAVAGMTRRGMYSTSGAASAGPWTLR